MRCNGTGTCLLSNFWAIDTLLCSKRLDSGQTYCILLHPLYTVAVRQVQFSCGDSDYFLDSGQTYVASALNSSRGSFSFHAGVTSHAKEVHKGARVELAPQVLAAANPTKPVARVTCTALVVATGARCECDFGLVDGRCRKHADVSRFHTFVPGAEVPMFPCLGEHVHLAAFHTQVLGVR